MLCQSTNPLGKSIDFVTDDVDSMSKEYEKWRKESISCASGLVSCSSGACWPFGTAGAPCVTSRKAPRSTRRWSGAARMGKPALAFPMPARSPAPGKALSNGTPARMAA